MAGSSVLLSVASLPCSCSAITGWERDLVQGESYAVPSCYAEQLQESNLSGPEERYEDTLCVVCYLPYIPAQKREGVECIKNHPGPGDLEYIP